MAIASCCDALGFWAVPGAPESTVAVPSVGLAFDGAGTEGRYVDAGGGGGGGGGGE